MITTIKPKKTRPTNNSTIKPKKARPTNNTPQQNSKPKGGKGVSTLNPNLLIKKANMI